MPFCRWRRPGQSPLPSDYPSRQPNTHDGTPKTISPGHHISCRAPPGHQDQSNRARRHPAASRSQQSIRRTKPSFQPARSQPTALHQNRPVLVLDRVKPELLVPPPSRINPANSPNSRQAPRAVKMPPNSNNLSRISHKVSLRHWRQNLMRHGAKVGLQLV